MNTLELSIRELIKAFSEGTTTPTNAVETALEHLVSVPYAFTQVLADEAFASAEQATRRWRNGCQLGQLDGVPASVKDLLDVKGTPTTAASEVYRNAPPKSRNAKLVQQLLDAGSCLIGKTNLTELAYSGIGMNPHFGNPPNVFSGTEPRISGGSSSGAATATAKGLTPVSIGTDTAGSVRIPSAMNGLVGFKPTTDYYSRQGVMPLSLTLDSVGLLARSVDDIRIIDATIHGRAPTEHEPSLDISDLVVISVEGTVVEALDEAVDQNYRSCLSRLKAYGATIINAGFPEFERGFQLIKQIGAITAGEVGHVHRELLASDKTDLMDPRILRRIRTSQDITASDYILLQEERKRLTNSLCGKIANSCLIAYPTVACTAPTIRELEESDGSFFKANARILRNTMIGNYLNLPSITLPSGTDGQNQTTGILFSTFPGNDANLLLACQKINNILNPKLERAIST